MNFRILLTLPSLFLTALLVSAQICAPNQSNTCGNQNYTSIISTSAPYNCHQYVRAAVVKGWVNMSSGQPTVSNSSILGLPSSKIKNDEKWIQVSSSNADAVVPEGGGTDHSAVLLNGGWNYVHGGVGDFASTPSAGSYLYKHSHATYSTTTCDFDMYAYMPNFAKSGSTATMIDGQTRTFSITGLPSFVSLDWEEGPYLDVIGSSTGSSFKVKANCGASSSSTWVKGKLSTDCITKEFVWNFTLSCCSGTINNSTLYTVNSVSQYSNQVIMDSYPRSWIKTSGNVVSWSTAQSGRILNFNINQGSSVSFSTNGCNLTFYRSYGGWGFMRSDNLGSKTDHSIEVYDMVSQTRQKLVGSFTEEDVIMSLDPGLYVISINGKKKKVFVK